MSMQAMMRVLTLALAALLCAAMLLGAMSEANPTLEPVQPLRSARIRAVGDLMAHQKQLDYALQADGSYDFHPQYALVADSLADADYTIANLETTIGKYGSMAYSGFPLFNSPEALLEAVKDAGVDFLTLANNHMLDRYYEGMLNTVNAVEAHGFAHAGANRSPEERDAPVVVEVNGIKLGMLSYTQMTNGMEAYCNSAVKEFGINYMRKANYKQDVKKLRDAGAEVVIAMPHWGEEYFRRPEQNTVNQAKLLIAAGVDVILGSHPHMVQPVEFVTATDDAGHERTGLVAYCLGNFISNMSKRYTDSGIILEFTLRERQDGSFAAEDVGCVPIFVWRQDGAIRALPSLKYYDAPPEGMASDKAERMRQTYGELRELIDDSIPMLSE